MSNPSNLKVLKSVSKELNLWLALLKLFDRDKNDSSFYSSYYFSSILLSTSKSSFN